MEPLPVIPIEASPSRRWMDGWSIVWLLIPIAPLAIMTSGLIPFRAGQRNDDPTAGLGLSFMALVLLLACGIALLLRFSFVVGKRDSRWKGAVGALGLAIVCWGALLIARPLPEDSYLRGFKQWARNNLYNISSARGWCASLPPVNAPTSIPTAKWPKAVSSLAPARVEQVPGGLTLQWGKIAAWGTSREIFIGTSPSAMAPAPPIDYHHYWIPAAPGLFVGVQSGG